MPRKTSIIFISGRSAADVLGGLGRAFRPIFEHFGHEFIEVNFSTDEATRTLDTALRETDVQFVFSFVGIGMDLQFDPIGFQCFPGQLGRENCFFGSTHTGCIR